MNKILTFFLLTFMAASLASQTPQLTVFANGFSRLTDLTHCGDDRLFVVEQRGKIWVLDKNGNKLPTPFLDIESAVHDNGNEQGLLGLAFHPNYAQNGFFYVNYTYPSGGDTRISRFTVSNTNPNVANPASELVLFEVDQPFSNHNGGGVKFGPDGYLYIGLGDGGSGGDPQGNGQKRTTLLGKMLRIDVDNGSPYSIPPSNPFVNDATTLDEIWALGMRNPWRFSFDRQTGDLWIGDVGQDAWEEIDFQPASSPGGENYGWKIMEGNHCYPPGSSCTTDGLVIPAVEYANSNALGCSITGGFVYRGFNYPNLFGKYLYTDYCTGLLWALTPDGNGGWINTQLANFLNNQLVSFGESKNGELFMLGNGNGNVYRLEDPSEYWQYTVTTIQPACPNVAEGLIQVVFSSNVPNPTVVWSDGFVGDVRADLPVGSYTFTLTGTNGATATETIVLSSSFAVSASVTNETCPGLADGAIDLNLEGANNQPTSAIWSDGSTDFDRTSLAPGTYSVAYTSIEGCVYQDTFDIMASNFAVSAAVTDASCPDAADGAIDLTLEGAPNQPTTASWSDGSNDFDRTGLAPGAYTVNYTSAAGCTYTATFTVTAPVLPPVLITFNMDTILSVVGSFDDYQWLLNGTPVNGANGNSLVVNETGTYSLQVTYPNGCTGISNEIVVELLAANTIPELTKVIVTPNPFSNEIMVEVNVKDKVLLELYLNDFQGKNYLTDRLAVTSQATRRYSLGEIPSGNYLLILKNGKGEWVEQVVKI